MSRKVLALTGLLLLAVVACAAKQPATPPSVPKTAYALSGDQLKAIRDVVRVIPCPLGKMVVGTLTELPSGGGVLLVGCQ